jgi:enoyl-CoA hydratase/carnithine racemase
MIDTTAQQSVTSQTENGIQTIVLSNAEKRNPLSRAAMLDVTALLEATAKDESVKVVIVRSLGPAFSAGHDLREVRRAAEEADVADLRDIFDTCVRLMTTIQSIPQPVIAQVSGIATAAGCQFVAACDLAIAESGARFATPGVKIGLFCTTPMVALTRAVGRKYAMEMLLLGEFIDAATAERWGLINRVVAPEALEAQTRAIAQQIAASSSFTIALGKQAFYAQIELDQPRAYAYAKEVMTMNALDADAREGIGAFLERRSPQWKS